VFIDMAINGRTQAINFSISPKKHEVTVEMQKDVENDNCKHNGKRALKVVEKVERLLLP